MGFSTSAFCRLVEQREMAEARGSVLSRELQAAEAQILQLRKALKGTGMLVGLLQGASLDVPSSISTY